MKSACDSFENARHLVEYMEFRLGTERALVSTKNLAHLAYIAGVGEKMSKKDYEGKTKFHSLHECSELVPRAKERIEQGLVPEDWFEEFKKTMVSAE